MTEDKQIVKDKINAAIVQIDQQIAQCTDRRTGEGLHMDAAASMIATKQRYIEMLLKKDLID